MLSTREERIEYWTNTISEAKESGQNIGQWCQERGIPRNQYYYWHKILRDMGCIAGNDGLKADVTQSEVPGIAEIRFWNASPAKEETPRFSPRIMVQRNSCQIYVGDVVDQETFRKVMEVISEC